MLNNIFSDLLILKKKYYLCIIILKTIFLP